MTENRFDGKGKHTGCGGSIETYRIIETLNSKPEYWAECTKCGNTTKTFINRKLAAKALQNKDYDEINCGE